MLQPLTEIFKSNQEREQLPTGRGELEYRITTMWDSLPVLQRPMTPKFRSGVQGLLMDLNAPFFDDPPAPHHEAGQPFDGLWKYEGCYPQMPAGMFEHQGLRLAGGPPP
ncbi:UPF0462 protein C4orf33 homolog isoform X3 [Camelus dromedarius]|uniref:UPF0462 protein C4orf33 homolog isoform X3 n=1 Tax=Camelus dromedarius TaxID=9838 RepID=UPI003119C3A6